MTSATDQERTEVGSVFVANYPPFSQWTAEQVPAALAALQAGPRPGEPLGLYIHIPFCRKRCKFCYFKVYTDKNADQIEHYLAAVRSEMETYSRLGALQGRPIRFTYFGGGTPSYLSERQLDRLVQGLDHCVSWAEAEEVTFEAEPGTLRESKLRTLRELGVTRLSLGIENFNDQILECNGRAHLSPEIYRAYDWARRADFPQINIDLIAGMAGETEENWRDCVRRAVELEPDSVTIYQMELPFNTVFSQQLKEAEVEVPLADWATKRQWVDYAFDEFEAHGYRVASAYTLATTRRPCRFVYTEALWRGADMIGLGVASFSHFGGVHFQNVHEFDAYVTRARAGELPLLRALAMTDRQRLIRELILQLKTGRLELDYFRRKFGVDAGEAFADAFAGLEHRGFLRRDDGSVRLTRPGLLRVDSFLSDFYEPEMRRVRYT